MAVKRSRSAGRMLQVFEALARLQPTGVSALARELEADKSAVQRDLMTLADAEWIRTVPASAGQWELSPHILSIARPPHSVEALRRQARPVLERLRSDLGETAYLAVPDGENFIVLAAAEGHHPLRMVPAVGIVIPFQGSATGRVVLPYLSSDEHARRLGGEPGPGMAAEMAATRARGYAVNDEEVQRGAVAIASPLLDQAGVPVGALVITGPAERLPPERREEIGEILSRAAIELARDLD
jgi:DNA-binding IclR family transcriptional regulator